MANAFERVDRLLGSSPRSAGSLTRAIRIDIRADVVALVSAAANRPAPHVASASHPSSLCAVPEEYISDCEEVIATGLPAQRVRHTGRQHPEHAMITPVDWPDGTVIGALIVVRSRAFTDNEVDFLRLLGIRLSRVLEWGDEQKRGT